MGIVVVPTAMAKPSAAKTSFSRASTRKHVCQPVGLAAWGFLARLFLEFINTQPALETENNVEQE